MPTDDNQNAADLPLAASGIGNDANKPDRPVRHRWKLLRIPLVFLVLFTGAVIGMYFQPPLLKLFFGVTGLEPGGGTGTPIAVAIRKVQTGEELAVVSEGDVVALGRIIPRGDVITLSTPFGAGDARIAEMRVKVGDTVQKGQILAVLDSREQLDANVATARAEVDLREAGLLQAREAVRASRDETRASLQRAEATASLADSELQRTMTLFERGTAAKSALERTQAAATEAAREVARLRATLSRFDDQQGAVQADIAVADAQAGVARAALDQAQANLEKAYVRSPMVGTILDIHVQRGESPGASGVLDIGDIRRMTAEVEVYQTLIGRVSIGDPVVLSAASLSRDLTGRVSAIGLEIGRQTITSNDPAANTDARVVKVVVDLDAASSELGRGFTNLEVLARIDAGRTP